MPAPPPAIRLTAALAGFLPPSPLTLLADILQNCWLSAGVLSGVFVLVFCILQLYDTSNFGGRRRSRERECNDSFA